MIAVRCMVLCCLSLPCVAIAQTTGNPVIWPQPESFYSNQGSNSYRSVESVTSQPPAYRSALPPVMQPNQWNVNPVQVPSIAPLPLMNYGSPSMPWMNNMPNLGQMPSIPSMNNFTMPYPNSISGLPNPMDPMGAFTNPVIPSLGTGVVNPMSMWPGGMMGNGLPFGFGR